MPYRKYFSIGIFLIFASIIIGATLYYSPGWGLMDDWQNLNIAKSFWESKNISKTLIQIIKHDLTVNGRFRPLYQLWIVSAYKIFYNFPLGLYIAIIVICLLALLLWGLIIHKVFFSDSSNFHMNVFIYPLSFFIFTPFWNNFMYISIQEKFVYIFGALSIYLYLIAYDNNKKLWLLLSLLMMIIGLLGKETGIYLVLVYCIYSLIDLLFFKKTPKLSLLSIFINISIFSMYYFFIKNFTRDYTSDYKSNLGLFQMANNLLTIPLFIKALFVFAVLALCLYFIKRKYYRSIKNEFIIFPLCLIMYIVVLLPWGLPNYILAPLSPFIFSMFYLVFFLLGNLQKKMKWYMSLCIICSSFLVLFYVIVPRISKMSDIKKIIAYLSLVEYKNPKGKYFFAPPFQESAEAMAKFANIEVIYLSQGVLDVNVLDEKRENYLIFGEDCTKIILQNVWIGKELYSNNTWKTFLIKKNVGNITEFYASFPKNFLQNIKDRIKKL